MMSRFYCIWFKAAIEEPSMSHGHDGRLFYSREEAEEYLNRNPPTYTPSNGSYFVTEVEVKRLDEPKPTTTAKGRRLKKLAGLLGGFRYIDGIEQIFEEEKGGL